MKRNRKGKTASARKRLGRKAKKVTSPAKGSSEPTNRPYLLRISRLTVDKLGVKLYDKVSAVVAELVANGYDADADKVTVSLPLSTVLATKGADGKPVDAGYVIEVTDDGHGMTPDEAIDHYLQVGRDRRKHVKQGGRSRKKQRPVMGRKGIGKLAPFGICKKIEVLSAGGDKTEQGYLITHFFMDFDDILSDTDEPVELKPGSEDRKYRSTSGTTVRMFDFAAKRVPDGETFHRQLAARFAFAKHDFQIIVKDTRNPTVNPPKKVERFDIPTIDGTRLNLNSRPVLTEDGEALTVTGWIGLARDAYKNEEMAGVRIYARDKIVATTRDFEQPAGFTGEFTIRSYLVGEVHAEWLDLDDGDDLVRSDRQGILWDSDYGGALRAWGASLIKEIGKISRAPRRQRKSDIFLSKSDFENKAKAKFSDSELVDVAVGLAKNIGAFAAEDELEDEDYVADLSEVILSVAPHKALMEAFKDFSKEVAGGGATIEQLSDLFGKTRVAELASYSQIASERVRAIRELEKLIKSPVDESKFQKLLADAPWLIEPTWSVITKNQSLKTFKEEFEHWWKDKHGEDVTLAIGFERKRPDFTLINVGHMLHIVEIKTSGHEFDDADFSRMINYVEGFDEFFAENTQFYKEFTEGYRIELIADGVKLRQLPNKHSFNSFLRENKVRRSTWRDFLLRAKIAHETFLEVSDKFNARDSSK